MSQNRSRGMDSSNSGQDLIRCELCESPVPPLHCDLCHTNLCKACVGEHISDFSKEHRVVQFSEQGANPVYPKCSPHTGKACELQCTKCGTPVCCLCVTESHQGHTLSSILKTYTAQKEKMRKDLEELLNNLREYENRAKEIDGEKTNLERKYEKLTHDVDQQGEKLHDEVNIFINERKIEINNMKRQHLANLNEQREEVLSLISEIELSFKHVNEMLDTNEVCKVSAYKSNSAFRKPPSQIHFSLPDISSQEIIREKVRKMFSALLPLSFLTENVPLRRDIIRSSKSVESSEPWMESSEPPSEWMESSEPSSKPWMESSEPSSEPSWSHPNRGGSHPNRGWISENSNRGDIRETKPWMDIRKANWH